MKNLLDKDKCTGCMACVSVCPVSCIEPVSDDEGFRYPSVDDEKCIECGACGKVCPVINKKENNEPLMAYAAYNKNGQSRYISSSGGVFSLLAEAVIEKGGIVFGAGFNDGFGVEHMSADSLTSLKKLLGSKYVQSDTCKIYPEVKKALEAGKTVLFSGTPCQIGGLKNYLKKDFDNLFLVSIICHGVPSPKIWDEYLKYKEKKKNSSLKSINFRSKKTGWKSYSVEFEFSNGKKYLKNHNEDLYMQMYIKNYSLREACFNCAFKTKEQYSDITLGDFWGIGKIHPGFDDNKGISTVFINSENGEKLFESIKEKLDFIPVDLSEALRYNSVLFKVSEKPRERDGFLKEVCENGFKHIEKKYFKQPFSIRIKRKAKAVLQYIKH